VSEVIRYDIDNPDHLRLSDNGGLVRHEDYQTLRDERDRIRAALFERAKRMGANLYRWCPR
jgi:hypothetical protein